MTPHARVHYWVLPDSRPPLVRITVQATSPPGCLVRWRSADDGSIIAEALDGETVDLLAHELDGVRVRVTVTAPLPT